MSGDGIAFSFLEMVIIVFCNLKQQRLAKKMDADFEKDVKTAFMKAKLGERIDEIAEVDLHFVLPLSVFAQYESLINEVTNGDFKVEAGYNLVLLYTKPQDSQLAGTVLFAREPSGLIAAWSNVLDDIAADPDKASQSIKFKSAHQHFRSGLWIKQNPFDPCASANPVPRNSTTPKRSILRRFLN